MITRDDALRAVHVLLEYIGDDPMRPGLRATPERVLRAWRTEWACGLQQQPPDLTFFPEPDVQYDQMVLVRDISVFSHCEHHLTPFYGVAHIGYLPGEKGIIGLSKLVRLADYYSRRLQVQERLTQQIAAALEGFVDGVGVVIHAKHMCMISRGTRQPASVTTTSVLRKKFLHQPEVREEFLALTRQHHVL